MEPFIAPIAHSYKWTFGCVTAARNLAIARESGSKAWIVARGITLNISTVVCPQLAPTSTMTGSSFPTHSLMSSGLNTPGVMGKLAGSVIPEVPCTTKSGPHSAAIAVPARTSPRSRPSTANALLEMQDADALEDTQYAERIGIGRVLRCLERHLHMALRRQVVGLVRLPLLDMRRTL